MTLDDNELEQVRQVVQSELNGENASESESVELDDRSRMAGSVLMARDARMAAEENMSPAEVLQQRLGIDVSEYQDTPEGEQRLREDAREARQQLRG